MGATCGSACNPGVRCRVCRRRRSPSVVATVPAKDTAWETVGGAAAPGERERTDVIRNMIRSVTCCCTRVYLWSQRQSGRSKITSFFLRHGHHKVVKHIKLKSKMFLSLNYNANADDPDKQCSVTLEEALFEPLWATESQQGATFDCATNFCFLAPSVCF